MSNILQIALQHFLDTKYWNKVYSDHSHDIYQIDDDIEALNWNIMTKCRNIANGLNNGFNKQESSVGTIDEYSLRLGRIAELIANFSYKHPKLAIISLQEVSDNLAYRQPFYRELQGQLGEDWVVSDEFYNNIKTIKNTTRRQGNFGNLLIYKKTKFKQASNITDQLFATDSQFGRFQLVQLIKPGEAEPSLLYANVHLLYLLAKLSIIKSLLTLGTPKLRIVIAGDFNCNIEKLVEDMGGLNFVPGLRLSPNGCITWNLKLNTANPPKIIDAFLSNLPFP